MTYEELLIEADEEGLTTKEKPLLIYEGRIKGNKIAIRQSLTTSQKACALSEELGHYYTNTGNIIDLSDVRNCKQEYKARLWAYDKQIGLLGLIRAYEQGCINHSEIAEYLEVTNEFLEECIECYRSKYGVRISVDNYIIKFEPSVEVIKLYYD